VESNLPATSLTCTQCGGELHPDEGQIFLTCPYCSSTVYLDKSRVVFHWYVAPTLDEQEARGSLNRWMSGSQTVKDLDRKSTVSEVIFSYFPVWYFKMRSKNGDEQIRLRPAAATSTSEISSLRLPAGDLRSYNAEIEGQAQQPSVPLQTALEWIRPAGASELEVGEQALVHIPIYSFKYTFNGQPYSALVEGATGEVFADLFPAKAEAPFLAVGITAALVYLCLALIPVMMGLNNSGEGAGLGLLICSGIGLVAGLGLFGFAAWVAAKI